MGDETDDEFLERLRYGAFLEDDPPDLPSDDIQRLLRILHLQSQRTEKRLEKLERRTAGLNLLTRKW